MNLFRLSLVCLVLVALVTIGVNLALADCATTGMQQHLVLSANRPSALGSVTFLGQVLRTPETKSEITTGYLGVRNAVVSGLSIEPMIGYVGGWYAGSDGVSIGSKFGAKQGPVALNLSFEWWSNTEAGYDQHTKFWVHTLTYARGPFTAGALFQKVDIGEKLASTLAYKGGQHWTIEGRWYQSLNKDPKLKTHVNNGRLVLKIS